MMTISGVCSVTFLVLNGFATVSFRYNLTLKTNEVCKIVNKSLNMCTPRGVQFSTHACLTDCTQECKEGLGGPKTKPVFYPQGTGQLVL
jgi:hypothetical protein